MTTSNLIGCSLQFQKVQDQIRLVAPTDATVLVQGETGTGKELVGRAIHDASHRRDKPFIAVNCAAIPAALLESELFGHERGAFTGAVAQRLGRFQMAHGGTLFLDEIGDLPLELQPKLLRALQERQFERVGGGRTVQVDVRVIAATHQDLSRMSQERRFRADLYYRLHVFPLAVPPLRERRGDIPLLAEHFMHRFAAQQGKTITHISPDALEELQNHSWPGNIRELQNCIERSVILTTGGVLKLCTAGLEKQVPASVPPVKLADVQREHILAVLHGAAWVVGGPQGAARKLGLARTTLIARMEKLSIQRPVVSQGSDVASSYYEAPSGRPFRYPEART